MWLYCTYTYKRSILYKFPVDPLLRGTNTKFSGTFLRTWIRSSVKRHYFDHCNISTSKHYSWNLLTHSMVQSPSWEANWFAASQEIPRISRNPKVHYRTHKRPPPVSILGQPNPVHIPTSHLLETHPNIIHPSTARSPQWSPSLRFPHQDPIHPRPLAHSRHMPGITNIYYRKTVRHLFTKPVQIEGTKQTFPPPHPPSTLFFILVHISAARWCECL